MKLRQPSSGFRYNTDSILLYHFVALQEPKGRVLDVGCGCGVIGLLLARDFKIELVGVDIQEEMIAYANENCMENEINAEFFHTDYSAFVSEKKFDLIVSNPPFYRANTLKSENESLKHARYASSLPIEQFLKRSNALLDTKGDLFFCYDAELLSEITKALSEQKYRIKTVQFVHRTSSDPARLVMIHAKKMAIKASKTLPPIFLHEGDAISQKMSEIAKKAGTLCVA